MKNLKGLLSFVVAIAVLLIPGVCKAESMNEEAFIHAIEEANQNGDETTTITLDNDIVLTKHIGITGKVIIDGNGHTISASDEGWLDSDKSDQSLITATGSSANVTLKNLKLTNSKKYGAQSYGGATLTLDGVTVENCKFGGILANGGTVIVKDLTLGYNGGETNNGIELSNKTESTPKLVMDGKLQSSQTENVIWIATNDGPTFTAYEVENTENTIDKVYTHNGQVVVTDENNNIIFESNKNKDVTATINGESAPAIYYVTINYNGNTRKVAVEEGKTLAESINLDTIKNAVDGKTFVSFVLADGTVYDENTKVTSDLELTAQYKDVVVSEKNPNTSDKILIYVSLVAISGLALGFGLKKRFN